MNEETPVSPDAETQNPAPVESTQAPEVVEPESNEAAKPDETPEEDPRDKTVKSLQRRIDRLTGAKYQSQAEVQEARRQVEELRSRLAQYEQPEQPQQQQLDPVQIAEYISEIKEHQKIGVEISKAGRANFPNFDKAISVVIDELGQIYDKSGLLTQKGKVIAECDSPAAVIHAIGTNPDLAAELADLSPTRLARRLDRLEIELSKPKEPPKSNAPKGLTPLKATTGGEKDPSHMSDKEFAEWRKRQIAQRR